MAARQSIETAISIDLAPLYPPFTAGLHRREFQAGQSLTGPFCLHLSRFCLASSVVSSALKQSIEADGRSALVGWVSEIASFSSASLILVEHHSISRAPGSWWSGWSVLLTPYLVLLVPAPTPSTAQIHTLPFPSLARSNASIRIQKAGSGPQSHLVLRSCPPNSPVTAAYEDKTLPESHMMLASVPMRPAHMESTESSMTSVAILSPSPIYAPSPRLPLKRPRLTLNTGHQRIYGKGPTSLRLDTLSAVSPTARNTFSNTFARPASPLDSASSEHFSRPHTPLRIEQTPTDAPNHTATPTSSLASSSAESTPLRVPYQQPHGLTSVLLNSLIPRIDTRKMSFSIGRPLFPPTKHVSFRNPLTEEIKTETYTLAHSDLDSASSSTTISSLSLSTDVLPAGKMPGSITQSPSGIQLSSQTSQTSTSISTCSSNFDASRPSLQLQRLDTDSTIVEPLSSLSSSSSSSELTFSLPSPRENVKHDSLEPLAPLTSTSKPPLFLSSSTTTSRSPNLVPPSPKSSPTLSSLSNSPRTGEKRDSSSSEEDDEDDDGGKDEQPGERDTRVMYPSTPIAGRRKRRREWVWTLKPLPGMKPELSSKSDEADETLS